MRGLLKKQKKERNRMWREKWSKWKHLLNTSRTLLSLHTRHTFIDPAASEECEFSFHCSVVMCGGVYNICIQFHIIIARVFVCVFAWKCGKWPWTLWFSHPSCSSPRPTWGIFRDYDWTHVIKGGAQEKALFNWPFPKHSPPTLHVFVATMMIVHYACKGHLIAPRLQLLPRVGVNGPPLPWGTE